MNAAILSIVVRTRTTSDESAQSVHLGGFLRIAALFVLFTAIYETSRHFVGTSSPAVPLKHARDVVTLERSLGLFVEPRLQAVASGLPGVESLATLIYKYEHLVGSIVFLVWLWLRRPSRFPFVWRWFWIAHAVALLGFWLFPLAPPRLVPELGLADPTAAALASTPGAAAFDSIRNEFAAMPSLHVGYPLLFTAVLWPLLPYRRLRWLVWLWPITVFFVVLVTANHYWLDAVGGALAVGMALALAQTLFPTLPRPWTQAEAPSAAQAARCR